jgi:DHA1 family bicyclomycin/chloramphenicol resistance-like MFS transporter
MNNQKLAPILVTAFIIAAEVAISFNSALLPNIKAEFLVNDQITQLTLAFGLFALGFAGIIYGGLADVFGRRPVFLFSITLFSTMALLSAYAPNIQIFIIARILQGMGAGAGWVVGNSCLNDIYKGSQYTKIMNYVHAIAGITPAVAPLIGAYLGVVIGWRNCFIVLFIITFAIAISIYLFLEETLTEKKSTNLKTFLNDYKVVFSNNKFRIYAAIKVISVMMIFCEIANVPLIFINHLDVTQEYYGFYILPVFLCYIAATLISSKAVDRISIDTILKIGLSLILFSNIIIILMQLTWQSLNAVQIQIIKSLAYCGWGCIFGNATAVIVSSVPGKSGMASAIMIALEMLCSSVGIYILGFFFNGSILPLSIFLALFAAIAYSILSLGMSVLRFNNATPLSVDS